MTAHQPVYLPWLGFFDKIARADTFCFLDTVPYGSKSFENRNTIKTSQGPLMLSVPVDRQANILKGRWARKHIRSIEMAYLKAPYFEQYIESLRVLLLADWSTLGHLNKALTMQFLEWLGLHPKVTFASDYSFHGEKSALILDMCKQLGATKYIFGSQGRDYADAQSFTDAGIEIEFQDYRHPRYGQLWGDFLPRMSVLDLLMNCGPGSLEVLRDKNA